MNQVKNEKEAALARKVLRIRVKPNSRGGQQLLIDKERIVVGTLPSCDLQIEDETLSPIHAVLEVESGYEGNAARIRLVDLSSTHGSFVNEVQVAQIDFGDTDQVRFGSVRVDFSFEEPQKFQPLPDSALLLIDETKVSRIFDPRGERKTTLEGVQSWKDVILSVKHFESTENTLSIGETLKDHFFAPLRGGISSISFIENVGSQWRFRISEDMDGVAYVGKKLEELKSLRKRQGEFLTLGRDDFLKFTLGEVSFYLSYTSGPPVLKKQRLIEWDPFWVKSFVISFAVTLLAVTGSVVFQDPKEDVIEVTQTVDAVLRHPELYGVKKKPKVEKKEAPKEVPEDKKKQEIDFTKKAENKPSQEKSQSPGKKQLAQNQAKGGEGARAKGSEGKRGAKNAAKGATPQTAATRTSPDVGMDRGGTVSKTQDNGNVQMLKGASNKILSLLGGSGDVLGKAGNKLEGFGGFATRGNGGAGLQGTGKGGGGNADTLLGGLGDKGRGGGKVGTGLGAEGTGTGIVGGKTKMSLNLGGGAETVVGGGIDRDAIERAIRARRDEFAYCQEREINANKNSKGGKVLVSFRIGLSGKASQVSVVDSSLNSPVVERCVLDVIKRIDFPIPSSEANVKYPFNFMPPSAKAE